DLSRCPWDELVFEDESERGSNALLARAWSPGWQNADKALTAFLNGPLMDYSVNRKKADSASTSLLSPYLHFGELSVRKVFHQVRMKRLMWSNDGNHAGEESCALFLCSIGLREYSRYLTFNHPCSHEKPLLSHLRFFPWVVNEVYIIKVLENSDWLYIMPWGLYKAVTYVKEKYDNPTSPQCFMSEKNVYLAETVMLIFGMGLYGLFVSNASADVRSESDRALSGSSLFGVFALKVTALQETPKFSWAKAVAFLKSRKCFVKIAIQSGCALVPVFCFGQLKYHVVMFKRSSQKHLCSTYKVKYSCNRAMHTSGGGLVVNCLSRSLEQLNLLLLSSRVDLSNFMINFHGLLTFECSTPFPFPKPMHVVVGKPIEVNKIPHPTIDENKQILLAFVSSGSERIRIGCIRRNKALRCDTIAGVSLLPATPLKDNGHRASGEWHGDNVQVIGQQQKIYIIKVPKFVGDDLWNKIHAAQAHLDHLTQERDTINRRRQKQKAVCDQYREKLEAARREEWEARTALGDKKNDLNNVRSVLGKLHQANSVEELDELVLKKDSDVLLTNLKFLEENTRKIQKSFEDERTVLRKLTEEHRAANEIRQKAYIEWTELRSEPSKKNEYFFRYRDDRNAVEIFRANGDINGLKSHCNSQ
ncbi:hypothetical protein ACJX0J_041817, partial [Zea mays]